MWYPETAIPSTLFRLDAVEALIPEELRDLYAELRQTALTVQAGLSSLPRRMGHGDAWPGNAVQNDPDTVTWAWLVDPDEGRIAAVARGYASQRVVGAAERALLPAAVRFGARYVGAIHVHQALDEGVRGASMEARLERLRNRVSVSEAVARLAAPHLASGTELADGAELAGGAETVR